jgi:hypothetical protein
MGNLGITEVLVIVVPIALVPAIVWFTNRRS